ncbi:MAG: site-2 protease family protein [Fibrella sp.]|nr:site-2 protease family protein [Armatimonadota bacterium]
MSIFGVLTFILVLAVLVFFHELGHFLFAKLFRMKVEEFAIGFGPRLLRVYHDGETEYNLRALPLGGFVRIKGMEIEDATERRLTGADAKTTDAPQSGTLGRDVAGLTAAYNTAANPQMNRSLDSVAEPHTSGMETTNLSTMSQEAAEVSGADPDGFNNRPIYQRFWVILGGPLFSFLFGWLALCLIGVTFGIPQTETRTTVIEQVIAGKPAFKAGIQKGDKIVAINDEPMTDGKQMVDTIHSFPGKPITLTVETAKKQTRTVTVTPDPTPNPEKAGETMGIIGIAPYSEFSDYRREGLADSFSRGTGLTAFWFVRMSQVLTTPKELGASVGGPVAILKQSNSASQQGGSSIVSLLGQLSLSLGLFNLFPIPILDGGHLALMALEKIRGRKLTADQTNRVFTAGFILMATLFVVILFKDIFGR